MSDLQFYLLHARAEIKSHLERQYLDAANNGTITCNCGITKAINMAYRCLYCGEWFCFNCAEIHFGQTFEEHVEEKRIKLSEELKNMTQEQILNRIKSRNNNKTKQ